MLKYLDKIYKIYQLRPWVFVLAFYTIIFFFLYYPVLSGHLSLKTNAGWPAGSLFVGDPTAGGPITMPQERIVASAWSRGQLPLWMPYEGYGMNLGGNQGVAWFLPEIIFHLLFPHNYSIWNVTRLLLMAFFTYALARDLKINIVPSMLSGLFISLSGPAVANINLGMDNPLMLFPLMLLFANRQIMTSGKSSVLWSLSFALVVSQAFLSGFDEVLPLELVVVGLFVLVRILLMQNVCYKVKIKYFILFISSFIVGFMGSAIATLELLQPLGTYFNYQSPTSYLTYATHLWVVTLVDPWFFGRSIAAMRYGMGETEWAYGNPFIWVLASLALPLIIRRSYDRVRKSIVIMLLIIVLFGVLGISNFLDVLDIFGMPVFRLIVMTRFLPFMWWLPLSLLASYGLDAISLVKRNSVISSLVLIGLLELLAIAFVVVRGPLIFPIASSSGIRSYVLNNWVFYALIVLATSIVINFRVNGAKYGLVALSILSLLIYLPKNFFLSSQNGSLVAGLSNQLKQEGRSSSLVYAPIIPFSSTSLSENNIKDIQAFGVFYPQTYANLIMSSFGSKNSEDPTGNLYPANPTLSNVNLNVSNISKMYDLGVRTLVLSSPISTISPFYDLVRIDPTWVGKERIVANIIAKIYAGRPDLQNAFPFNKSNFTVHLINWASTAGLTIDGSHVLLDPYRKQIMEIKSRVLKDKKLKLFSLQSIKEMPSIHFIGMGTLGSINYYIYSLGSGSGLLWTPQFIVNLGNALPTLNRLDYKIKQAPRVAYVGTTPAASDIIQTQNFKAKLINWTSGEEYQTVEVQANSNGYVVLRSQYTKNQIVYVNGKSVPFNSVDGAFTGFTVPKGTDLIRLDYLTYDRLIAWIVTLILNSSFALGILWLSILRKREYR